MTYRTVEKHAEETGYTLNAIYSKTSKGVWPEGIVWMKAPDGKVMISKEGYEAWVEGKIPRAQKASGRRQNQPSKSTSTGTEGDVNRASKPSPRQPTF